MPRTNPRTLARLAALEQRHKRPHPTKLRHRSPSSAAAYAAAQRVLEAADSSDLYADFGGSNASIDVILESGLARVRGRSRELAQNNDYARHFLSMLRTNVVGRHGIRLVPRLKWEKGPKRGQFDDHDNAKILEAWDDWGGRDNCEVTGRLSWVDVQRLVVESWGRDGEILVRMIGGYSNRHRFAVQVLEVDHLPEELNGDLANGNRIRMGVELDQWNKPVAYHLRTDHPGDTSWYWGGGRSEILRVPAEEILHVYQSERPQQTRGLPAGVTAMKRLHMLGAYEEAELVASRLGASKMGFFKSAGGAGYTGDDVDGEGHLITEVDPGHFEQLPEGVELETFDPQHPNSAYRDFVKACLRGIAAGFGVSYSGLANDLEAVNFSSIRAGLLEERDGWRAIQDWLAGSLCRPVYNAWLAWALTTQALELPPRQMERFRRVSWRGRGWPWVDPLKDAQSAQALLGMGATTLEAVALERGEDWRELLRQRQTELAYAAELGVPLVTAPPPAIQPDPPEEK